MANRYFSAVPISPGARSVQLTGPEAHHLSTVMRARPGDRVVLIDGSGNEYSCRIAQTARSAVELELLETRQVDRELIPPVTLAVAVPKGDRGRFLVEKAVELGASRLVPLVTERAVVRPKTSTLQRLRRTVVEATKQCERTRLMEIAEPCAWAEWLEAEGASQTCIVAHPGDNEQTPGRRGVLDALADCRGGPVAMCVGPEGGWSDNEIDAARRRECVLVDLGPRILRVETAAVALLARLALASR